jgi:hypothetical protein
MKKKGGDGFIVEGCKETGMGNSQERGEGAILTREEKKKIEGKRSYIIGSNTNNKIIKFLFILVLLCKIFFKNNSMVHPCRIDNSITLHGHGITPIPYNLQDPPPCLIHDNHTQNNK